MATYITEACINCGLCEAVCPNRAISPTEYLFLIDPELCTECVGFHDQEQCQAVCPVACCLPDPEFRESKKTLLKRALRLHPNDAALRARATPLLGLLALLLLSACGGAAPLMHAAHALPSEQLTLGLGFSGQVAVNPSAIAAADADAQILEQGSVAPGVAPWIGGRLGLPSNFEAGVTYTGRRIRADARHVFLLDGPEGPALSVGLGASALLPKRSEGFDARIGGGGADLPILFGIRSDADLYAAWIGLRNGFEILNGQRELPQADPLDPAPAVIESIRGWHVQSGAVLGFRIGFRHLFAVVELDASMHWAAGDLAGRDVAVQQFTLAPSGAVIGRF